MSLSFRRPPDPIKQSSAQLVRGLSLEDYIASPHVSHTGLRDFAEYGPRGYFLRHIHGGHERPLTKAMAAGQRFEDLLTGSWTPTIVPDSLPDEKGISKPWQGNRKVCNQWLAANPGAITQADYDNMSRMRDSVMANATARELLEKSDEQLSIRCDFDGLPGLQSRPDWLLLESVKHGPVYLDLKKVASLTRFRRYGVHDYGCNTQAGLCNHTLGRLGIQDVTYYLLAVEESFPNRAVLQRLTERTVQTGELWCLDRAREMADHYESDHWPQSVDDVEDLDAPVRGMDLAGE